MTKLSSHQTKTINIIRSMGGLYVGFAADRTIKALVAKGYITFSPTAFGAGYCNIKVAA